MIAYKVVEKGTRHCSNWTMFKNGIKAGIYKDKIITKCKKFRQENKAWFPRYLKGKTIKTASTINGILCFRDRTDAENFRRHSSGFTHVKTIIIKVEGKNQIDHIRLRGGCGSEKLTEIKGWSDWSGPKGTIAFKQVTVLE